jgi:hypothetical protein
MRKASNYEYIYRRYIDRFLRTRVGVATLGLVLFALGVRCFDLHLGIASGALGTFLALTGLQIFMWSVGIRLELFGTTSDADCMIPETSGTDRHMLLEGINEAWESKRSLTEEEMEARHERTITTHRLKMQREIEELELLTKLETTRKERLLVELEVAELEAKLSEFREQHFRE